jgi:quinol monooxygenase YgiN
MYAVISRWQLRAPATEALLTQIEQRLVDPISRLPGFNTYDIVRLPDNEIGAIHFWASQPDADRALQQGSTWIRDLLAAETTGTPQRSVGEVAILRTSTRTAGTGMPAYAIVSRFQFHRPLSAALVDQINRDLVEPFSRQPGFHSYYGLRTAETEVTTVHTWESHAQAQEALQEYGPKLVAAVQDELAAPPERSMGEIAIHRGG